MCPPGPNAREPMGRSRPGWSPSVGARPCLVNEGARGQTLRALLGLAEGWPQSQALAVSPTSDLQGLQEEQTGLGCGGPDTGEPVSSSS